MCDREASIMMSLWPTVDCCANEKKKNLSFVVSVAGQGTAGLTVRSVLVEIKLM